jgi:hypothetical protein
VHLGRNVASKVTKVSLFCEAAFYVKKKISHSAHELSISFNFISSTALLFSLKLLEGALWHGNTVFQASNYEILS